MSEYCTLAEVKAELKNSDVTEYDDILTAMIEQAKDFIDEYCDRKFDTVAETRYFDGAGTILLIDDLASISGESDGIWLDLNGDGTYEQEMTNSDYYLYPLNKNPKTRIKINPNGDFSNFASGIMKGVKITATWGYDSSILKTIRRANIIQACHWFKRSESAFQDVSGNPETGELIIYKGLDPDVKLLLAPLRKVPI